MEDMEQGDVGMGELVNGELLKMLTEEDKEKVRAARETLEDTNLVIRLTNLLGKPLQLGFDKLPENWRDKIGRFTQDSLTKVMQDYILPTLGAKGGGSPWNLAHKLLATVSGAVGGAGGFAALAVELPISTGIFLRSIMDIARSHGRDISQPATILDCYSVFAFAGPGRADDTTNEIYYLVRASLTKLVDEAATYLAARQAAGQAANATAPALVRLMAAIAGRYGVVLSNKAAAQAVPVAGAFTGGLLNYYFLDYFQSIADAHFTLRGLEDRYGMAAVRAAYDGIAAGR